MKTTRSDRAYACDLQKLLIKHNMRMPAAYEMQYVTI